MIPPAPLIREKVATTRDLEMMVNIIVESEGAIDHHQICELWREAVKRPMPLNVYEFAYLKEACLADLAAKHPPRRPCIPEAAWG